MKVKLWTMIACVAGAGCGPMGEAPQGATPGAVPPAAQAAAPSRWPAEVVASEPEAAARLVLGSPADLVQTSVRQSLTGEHVRFAQLAPDGTRVGDTEVSVHFAGSGPRYRVARVYDAARRPLRMVGTRRVGEADARLAAEMAAPATAAGTGAAERIEAMAIPAGDAEVRPGWRVLVRDTRPSQLWEVWVDGETGTATVRRNLLWYVNGTGKVFRPNPLTSAGLNPAFTDNNNMDSSALDAAQFSVTLTDLDGSGHLSGAYVNSCPTSCAQRVTSATNAFNFNRSQTGFEETNAYFHITQAQRNLQALGFTGARAILNMPLPVFVDSIPDDNSNYDPGAKNIHYGSGGVDDAEDGDVIIHEYGHAVQDDIAPGFGASEEAGAMGEGWGDTLAGSTPTGAAVMVNRACIAPWDATSYSNTNPPCLRRLDGQKHYPEALDGEVHDDGEIWSGAVHEMVTTTGLGPDMGLQLVTETWFSLPIDGTMPQWVDVAFMADMSLFGGAHLDAMKVAFWKHGIYLVTLPPAAFGGGTVMTVPTTIASPGPIPNSADGQMMVNQPGATAIRLHFATFATEMNGSCLEGICDRVYLFDGQGRLYARLGGNLGASNAPAVPGDTVVIRWVSDSSVQSMGFTVDHYDYITEPLPPDGGMFPDGPPPVDAAPDGAMPPDGPAADAAPPADGAVDGSTARDSGTGGTGSGSSGCGCRVGDASSPPGASGAGLLLALAVLGGRAAQRRRRR